MKKLFLLLLAFPFFCYAEVANFTDLTPAYVFVYSSTNTSDFVRIPVDNWESVYSTLFNSKLIFRLNTQNQFSIPSVTLSSTNYLVSSGSTSVSPQNPIAVRVPDGSSSVIRYVSPFYYPPIRSFYQAALALVKSGFTGSSIQSFPFRYYSFRPSFMVSEVLSSSSFEFRSTLLSNLSSIDSSISLLSDSVDSASMNTLDLLTAYKKANSFALSDFSSLSNKIISLAYGNNAYGYSFPQGLLDDLNPSYWDLSSASGVLGLSSSHDIISHALDSYYKFVGLPLMISHDDLYGNNPLSRFITGVGNQLTRPLSTNITSKLDQIKNSLPEIVSGSNRSFQVSLNSVFTNNWNLVTNDHNVLNQALLNITNFIQGADLGQIHNALSNIVVNTSPLPNVYRKDDKALQVYVVNPSNPSYPPGADPSSQLYEAFGGWLGEGGTNTWNLYAGNMLVDLEQLIDLVRAFRYDFQDWSQEWGVYRDKAIDHFDLHRSYVSYITNFVSDVLSPTMSMLRGSLIDYTNVLSVASSRLAKDYDLENGSTLAYTSSMLANIPETESLLHDVQELTNVVDFSSRSLIEQSLATTNQFNDAVSLYYKDVSLPSKIDLDIYQDISFSIPVSQQASLWTLMRNGLGFGLFIVNVLLFPKFLLHLLRLLFGAADSFYANQAKP